MEFTVREVCSTLFAACASMSSAEYMTFFKVETCLKVCINDILGVHTLSK